MSLLRWRKVAGDAKQMRARVAIMVGALVLSIVALTAFLSARAITEREVAVNYAATIPASATLHLPGGVDAAALEIARTDPAVLVAAARDSVILRAQDASGAWRPMLAFVVPADDARELAVVDGSVPTDSSSIALERTAASFLGLTPGDRLEVRRGDGSTATLDVAGTVHDGGVAPSEQEQTAYGYLTPEAAGLDRVTHLLVRIGTAGGASTDAAEIDAVLKRLAAALETRGYPVESSDIPPPARHPHQGQMATVSAVFLVFGVAAVLLSSLLVAALLGGMLVGQTAQIGTMRTIGASPGAVAALVLRLTVAIGVVATALSIIPGVLLGRVLAQAGARMLNLDLTSQDVPLGVLAVAAATGLLVPLAVAIPPILRATRRSVRWAIDGGERTSRTPRRAVRPRFISRPVALAARNALRRPGRTMLLVSMLALSGTLLLTGVNSAAGWGALVEQGISSRHYDAEIRLTAPTSADQLDGLRALDGVASVEQWDRAPAAVHEPGRVDTTSSYPDESHSSFTALGVPDGSTLMTLPLEAGRWLEAGETEAVVLNTLVPLQQGVTAAIGDPVELTIGGRPVTLTVVGLVRDFGTQGTAYLTQAGFAAADPVSAASLLRIVTNSDAATVLETAVAALDADGVGVSQAYTVSTLRVALDGHVAVLITAILLIAGMTALVGLAGLAAMMITSVTERTREIAVLRVVGAAPPDVRSLVTTEGALIGGVSAIVAALLSLPVTAAFGAFIGWQAFRQPLPYAISVPTDIVWLVVAVLSAMAASQLAARRAARLTIREALTTL